ncbi:Ankyrin repeat and SAM domain-containing protein 1A [Lasiodiplodia hormozganensis]|uniref:Ankyrin repeat and SAM domain-containing protein 1A n=1 Tax=Lasiodiplodia hormozganensis TaxID=869390 RepID=A0AA39U1P1_9PEZI|nr:Ankyrin repeat and SAM domain-containing protein 1A [Lasiodiplodia hormozganensis]
MMAPSTNPKTLLHSKNTITSSNNLDISISNTGINFGQQIGQANYKYFTTISDEASHKSFAESSFRKYQNLSARAIEDIQGRRTYNRQRVLYFFAGKEVDEARLKGLQPTLENVLATFWDQLGVDEDGGIGAAATKNLSETDIMNGILWKLKESKTKHISMLIDAFDTLSSNDQERLHSTLLKECRKDKIQVSLLTSHTRASTTPAANSEIHVTTDKNGEDMKRFLRAKLSEKMMQRDEVRMELTQEEKEEVEEIMGKIMERAQEMFLWAAVMLDLVCRAHDRKEREQVLERLLLPKYIHDDYEKLVERWEGKTARGRLEEWQRKLAWQATGLLAHKQGQLSYGALTDVLEEGIWEATAQDRVVQMVVECCSPFIEYDKELAIFRFAHPSMHEFFVKRDASRTAFADQTLAYLCRPAFRRGPFPSAEWWDMGELRPFLDSHPFLGFAAANWVDAVRNSKAPNGQNRKSTRNLLAELYGSDENLLLAFQVWRIAANNSVPAQLRSAHIFSFFGLFDNLFSSSSRFTTVHDAAMTDSDGHNALHWALRANDANMRLQTVRILICADSQHVAIMVAAQDSSGLTPLHYAARQGDLGVVRLLLSRVPDKRALNVHSQQYGTPLLMAAAHGRVDVFEELIKAGANLDVKCNLGNVLHAAAQAPDEAAHACVAAILSKHPRPRRLDVNFAMLGTPLHTAAYRGRESVVRLLLDAHFSVRNKSWEYYSTITAAAAGCHSDADPTPFLRIMAMLHDAGAKAHAAGITGYYGLHYAAKFGQPEIARFLHNCGANCYEKGIIGTTPLAMAAERDHMDVVKVRAFCDTTLSHFRLRMHNNDGAAIRGTTTVGTKFHPGTYEDILERLTLTAVRTVGLLERLVERRAQALKNILTDTTKTVTEKRHDAGILAKVGIELPAVALRRRHDDAGAARLASSLAKLWASALHDPGGSGADATRVEDIYYVCSPLFDMFDIACKKESSLSRTSADDDRMRTERVCLLAQVGAKIVVEAVRTDKEPLINNMRRMMDLGRKAAAAAGLKAEVEKVLMGKHDSLKKARRTAPAMEKRDSVISGQTTPVWNKEISGGIGGKEEGSNGKSDAHEGSEIEGSEGSEDGLHNDEIGEGNDGKSKTDREVVESRRLRITLRILRGDEGVITKPNPRKPQTQHSSS